MILRNFFFKSVPIWDRSYNITFLWSWARPWVFTGMGRKIILQLGMQSMWTLAYLEPAMQTDRPQRPHREASFPLWFYFPSKENLEARSVQISLSSVAETVSAIFPPLRVLEITLSMPASDCEPIDRLDWALPSNVRWVLHLRSEIYVDRLFFVKFHVDLNSGLIKSCKEGAAFSVNSICVSLATYLYVLIMPPLLIEGRKENRTLPARWVWGKPSELEGELQRGLPSLCSN